MKLLLSAFILIATICCKAQDTSPAGDSIYAKVDIEAGFPGGQPAFQKFLDLNMQYPKEAADRRIRGTVLVQLVVEKDGTVSDVQAAGSAQMKLLREEAIRLMRRSGVWTPAMKNGAHVRSFKLVLIDFTLKAPPHRYTSNNPSGNSTCT